MLARPPKPSRWARQRSLTPIHWTAASFAALEPSELLKVKADLERELGTFSLNCSKCGLDVHWVSGSA